MAMLADNVVTSFGLLQAATENRQTGSLMFFAFDLLYLDGENLMPAPLGGEFIMPAFWPARSQHPYRGRARLARRDRRHQLLCLAGELVSYLGLNPSVRQSGKFQSPLSGRIAGPMTAPAHHGRISKQGGAHDAPCW